MCRILIIDDDEKVRRVLTKLLNRQGHSVATAPNGREGIRLCRAVVRDVVITDILMPENEGIEVICELKRGYPDMKVIAISGGGDLGYTDCLKYAELLGADFTLAKPFRAEDLLQAVQFVLQT